MIKLTDILKELAPPPPEKIYSGGEENTSKEDEFLKQGYRLKTNIINPDTGKSETEVEYLPEFEQIKKDLLNYRKQFQPFKFSSHPDIAKLSKDINTNLTKTSQMIFALDKMIELYNKK